MNGTTSHPSTITYALERIGQNDLAQLLKDFTRDAAESGFIVEPRLTVHVDRSQARHEPQEGI